MFASSMLESTTHSLEMTDFAPTVVQTFLAFLSQGGSPDKIDKSVALFAPDTLDLMRMAHKYDVADLQVQCEYRLATEHLTATNVLELLDEAMKHSAKYLENACLSFIASNASNILNDTFIDAVIECDCGKAVLLTLGKLDR
jgi:hypothetical protein